jgi:hypothetical protein
MPSWLRWFSPKARVAAALERLSASGVTVFPELEPVTRVDLIEWFKQHMRCDEATVMAKCAEFLKGASRRRMADIEPLLAATFEKYAYEHG